MDEGNPNADMIEWFRQRDRETAEKAATAARAEIVAWLEWRFNRMQAMARDLCAEEITGDAGTYRDIADAIESGAPQRWAAEREGQGRG